MEVLPTRLTRAKNDRMSPTRTGCLKMNSFTATVATRPWDRRAGSTEPARSTWAITQPPKMSPLLLVSPGMGMTRSTSSLSSGRLGAMVRRVSGSVMVIVVMEAGIGSTLLPQMAKVNLG